MGQVLAQYEPHDEDAVVTISYVDRPNKQGWWTISDSLQRRFVTKNVLVATLAEQYRIKGWRCRPVSVPKWPSRELIGVCRAEERRVS